MGGSDVGHAATHARAARRLGIRAMRRFSVSSKLVSFAVFFGVGGMCAGPAAADDDDYSRCLEIEQPTTITSEITG